MQPRTQADDPPPHARLRLRRARRHSCARRRGREAARRLLEEEHLRRAPHALVEHRIAGCGQRFPRADLDDGQCALGEPAPFDRAASAGIARPSVYGGSRKTRSISSSDERLGSRVASIPSTSQRSVKSRDATFCAMAWRAPASWSMKRQDAAPRDSASSPSAPDPAKRSATWAPANGGAQAACSSTLNSA